MAIPFEPFRQWLTRDDIVEIAINPDGQVWIEVAGDAMMRPADTSVDPDTAQNLAQSNVGDAKARVSEKNPLMSGKIDYAGRPLRVQVAVPPAIDRGASITGCSRQSWRISSSLSFCMVSQFHLMIGGVRK